MTDTAVSYGNRANARRAAKKLLTGGIAPAVDYGIEERDDGRFEIAGLVPGREIELLLGAPAKDQTFAVGDVLKKLVVEAGKQKDLGAIKVERVAADSSQ